MEIKGYLESVGAKVDYYKDKPSSILYRKIPSFFRNYILTYWHKMILERVRNSKYDYILVIKGEGLNRSFMGQLIDLQPESIKIYYGWDSLYNYNYLWILGYFDNCYSFDQQDSSKIRALNYLPTYYVKSKNTKSHRDIDLFTLSGGYNYREPILSEMVKINNFDDLNIKFYLLNKRRYILQFFIKSTLFIYLWNPISNSKYKRLLQRSKVVIDIHHEGQSGLTQRTFEGLSSGCKLLTTNSNVLHENGLSHLHDRINIVDRNNPVVNRSFVKNFEDSSVSLIGLDIDHFINRLFFG